MKERLDWGVHGVTSLTVRLSQGACGICCLSGLFENRMAGVENPTQRQG